MIPGIWTAIYPDLPLHQALRALHGCGWRAVEISNEHLAAIETAADPDGPIEMARHCLHELGLAAPQAHAHLRADVAGPDTAEREKDIGRLGCHVRIAARLGVQNVVTHPGGRQGFTTGAEQRQIRDLNVQAFRRLGDVAGEHSVRIGIENLMRRDAATPAEMLDLLAAIDHPSIGITVDTSHANAAKLNVADVVRELGQHLVATHISDNDGSGDQHRMPGAGTIDWPEVMRAFHEVHYEGLFNLEIPGEHHALPALQQLRLRYALDVAKWLIGLADSQEHKP